MCILIVKKMGQQYPSIKNIEQSAKNNPDGFSYALYNGGETFIFKTMNKKDFLASYREMIEKFPYKETSMIIHCRIATHGSKKTSNCHCWENNGIIFAHNGILHNIRASRDMTDSQTFFDKLFIPVYKENGWKYAEMVADAIVGTSKFAFMFKEDGSIKTMGTFITDKGIMYSNMSYLPNDERYFGYPKGQSKVNSWDFHYPHFF